VLSVPVVITQRYSQGVSKFCEGRCHSEVLQQGTEQL